MIYAPKEGRTGRFGLISSLSRGNDGIYSIEVGGPAVEKPGESGLKSISFLFRRRL